LYGIGSSQPVYNLLDGGRFPDFEQAASEPAGKEQCRRDEKRFPSIF
jgi:hypothetical protein